MNRRTSIRPLWELKELWANLSRVPVVRMEEASRSLRNPANIEDVGTIKERWHTFDVGTPIAEIHEWFASQNAGFHPTLYLNDTMREYSNVATVPWVLRTDMLDELLLIWELRPYYVTGCGDTNTKQQWSVMFHDREVADTYRAVIDCYGGTSMTIATALAERLNTHYRWEKLIKRIGKQPELIV